MRNDDSDVVTCAFCGCTMVLATDVCPDCGKALPQFAGNC